LIIALDFISGFSILAPLIVGAIFYSQLMRASKAIFLIVLITFVMEIIVQVLAEAGINNMPVFHLYTFLEFSIILIFYRRLKPSIRWNIFTKILFIIFIAFSIINLTFNESIFVFNSLQRNIEALLLSIVFVSYLSNFFNVENNSSLRKEPFFIQTAGFMLYFGGTLFLFTFGVELLKEGQSYFWMIHALFNILLNIIYTHTLWKAKVS
jgi:hypothetical protein